jgi:hypothetical protein
MNAEQQRDVKPESDWQPSDEEAGRLWDEHIAGRLFAAYSGDAENHLPWGRIEWASGTRDAFSRGLALGYRRGLSHASVKRGIEQARQGMGRLVDPSTLDDDGMCPNCITPWKCNGPHEEPMQEKPEAEVSEDEARALFGDDERWRELGGWFRDGYRVGIEDERRRAANEGGPRMRLYYHQREELKQDGAKAERAAAVRWLRDHCGWQNAAEAIAEGEHLKPRPPEPTREQAEERVVRCMVRAAMRMRRDESGEAMGDDELDATLVQAQEMFGALPKPAQDAAIDAMLAEMRGEAGK